MIVKFYKLDDDVSSVYLMTFGNVQLLKNYLKKFLKLIKRKWFHVVTDETIAYMRQWIQVAFNIIKTITFRMYRITTLTDI